MPIWNTEDDNAHTIVVGDETVTIEDEVTAEDVQEVARNQGIGKFRVLDEDGNEMEQSDFPVSHGVELEEYNENA